MQTTEIPTLLSFAEAAKRCKCRVSFLRVEVERGALRQTLIGKRPKIDVSDLREWIEERKTEKLVSASPSSDELFDKAVSGGAA